MPQPKFPTTAHDRASPWAVLLLIISTAFAMVSIALLSTSYGIA